MSLLNRLKRAVKKVRLLLNFNANRWRIATALLRGRSFDGAAATRVLSSNGRPGLAYVATDHDYYYYDAVSEDSASSFRSAQLERTTSYRSDHDFDIDQKAEDFIANFRKQLQMERQISLEVRYYRGNSFD